MPPILYNVSVSLRKTPQEVILESLCVCFWKCLDNGKCRKHFSASNTLWSVITLCHDPLWSSFPFKFVSELPFQLTVSKLSIFTWPIKMLEAFHSIPFKMVWSNATVLAWIPLCINDFLKQIFTQLQLI